MAGELFRAVREGDVQAIKVRRWSRDWPVFLKDPWRFKAPALIFRERFLFLAFPSSSLPTFHYAQHCIRQYTDAVFDRDEHGRTPLILAAAKGQADALRALASAGGQVNVATRGG